MRHYVHNCMNSDSNICPRFLIILIDFKQDNITNKLPGLMVGGLFEEHIQ